MPSMSTSPGLAVALPLLLSTALIGLAGAREINIYSHCADVVWCAPVRGCEGCAPPDFQPIQPGSKRAPWYLTRGHNVGMTIQCRRAEIPGVTQIEWTREPEANKLAIDLSNVEGQVFVEEGMMMTFEATDLWPSCYDAICQPGEDDCQAVYEKWHHDQRGMRTCSADTYVEWHLCLADPTDPSVAEMRAAGAGVQLMTMPSANMTDLKHPHMRPAAPGC